MSATTNLLVFNPTQANQENDAAYLADATRTGGALDGNAWPDVSANKTLNQVTTYLTALFTAFANKGFATSDAALSTLTAQCANFLTTADQRGGVQNVAWAPAITLNVQSFLCFNIALAGGATLNTTSVQAGDLVVILYTQDATGGRAVTFGAGFSGAAQPAQAANAISAQVFIANAALVLIPVGALMSAGGEANTPIGAAGASTGAFTTLTATTPASSDNSTRVATTAWNLLGFAVSLGVNGYIKLPAWLGGVTLQWCQGASLLNGVSQTTYFPTSFSTACRFASVNSFGSGAVDTSEQVSFTTTGWTATSVTYFYARNADHGGMTVTPLIWAVGN